MLDGERRPPHGHERPRRDRLPVRGAVDRAEPLPLVDLHELGQLLEHVFGVAAQVRGRDSVPERVGARGAVRGVEACRELGLEVAQQGAEL
ncbi:MAG: hypothetical protein ACTMIE_07715, partial [Cellulosimicrobium funkei]